MTQYRVIQIRNIEPLKIGAGGSKSNPTEPSKDYIPGSTIRGAFIAQWIKQGIFTEETGPSIVKGIDFYNAYPYRSGKLFIPTPQHLRVNKHIWRQKKADALAAGSVAPGAENMSVQLSNLLLNGEDRNTLEYRFISAENHTLVGAKISKYYTLHHSTSNKPLEREKENLFNYQALAPGQTFQSILSYDLQKHDFIEALFAQKESLLVYMGGSKGSGYGLCEVRAIGEAQTDYREAKKLLGLQIPSKLEPGKEFTVTCLSDCLFRDESGRPVNELPMRYLQQRCGDIFGTPTLTRSLVLTGLSEGFNTKWGARYPKETVLRAGSVLHYEWDRTLTEAEWERVCLNLEQRLLGMRTQDGYGWIGINLNFPLELKVEMDKDSTTIAPPPGRETISVEESSREKEMAARVKGIIEQGLKETKDQWLRMIVLKSGVDSQPAADRMVLGSKLQSHHLQLMLRELRLCISQLREPGGKRRTGEALSRRENKPFYLNHAEMCSIADCSFTAIIAYLNGGGEESANRRLETYADKMLGSKRGRLYYANEPHGNRLFVAELLEAGLYYLHRRDVS